MYPLLVIVSMRKNDRDYNPMIQKIESYDDDVQQLTECSWLIPRNAEVSCNDVFQDLLHYVDVNDRIVVVKVDPFGNRFRNTIYPLREAEWGY